MIKQGIQTNFPDERIQKWGCYFLCLVKWAQEITGEEFTIDKICAERNEAEQKGYVDDEMTVINAPALLNQLTRSNMFSTVRRQSTEPQDERYIVCLTKPGYTHFVFEKKWIESPFGGGAPINAHFRWDSLDPHRPAAAQYEVDSYRVII
ncbi:MAG: DUF261 domain-containing protein [Tannerella sp.]|jgi:hypothetical protein|nr:DUF261 domain-containing protein [Tannerella sp.]